eukprot:3479761-Amphidinium_carterae.1
MALGCWRSWGCVCTDEDRGVRQFCPYHSLRLQLQLLRRHFLVDGTLPAELPLFPSATGNIVSKHAVVCTLRSLAEQIGADAEHITGHTFR